VLIFFLPATGLLKVIFFPGGDSELMILEIETPKGTLLEETDIAVRQAEEFLYDNEAIESFVTSVGGGSSFLSGGSGGNLANITINLKERSKRAASSFAVEEDLRQSLDEIKNISYSLITEQGGPPTGAPIVAKLYGDDLRDLERASVLVEQELRRMEGTKDVTSSLKDNGTEVVLTVNRDRVAELGLSPFAVADALRTALTGNIASSIETGTEDIDIRVRLNLNPNFRDPAEASVSTLDAVRQIPIKTPTGSVLLGSLVTESVGQGRSVIQRENRERTTSVSSYVQEGSNPVVLSGQLEKKIPELHLPDGVRVSFGGEDEEVNRSFAEMGIALIAGLILMLTILVLEFNSFRYSGYILLIVPLTLIGVFVGLAVLMQPLSFPSMLGVIALAGVIVNHAIILVDSMLYLRREKPNLPLKELIVDASVVRLRPILLTTFATAVGMIPLMTVSSLWAPLATAVMFGMLFSLVLTLVTIPLLCYRFPGSALMPKK
jgi:HAE1 family hydrophobic/amphiphilic exporter-1